MSEATRQSRWATILIGIAVMSGIDEFLFHQVLGWHHFYDRSTPAVGLVSDGFLHAAELLILVAGFFKFAELRRRQTFDATYAWSGFLIGAGGFQLFDGLVDHKVLRLHQIRYGVPIVPYDIAWNLVGAALLVGGLYLGFRASRGDGVAAR